MSEQIRVGGDTWRQLNARKRPGDSFDDVIQRLLEGDQ
jgi:predicted CopG family antitoxin